MALTINDPLRPFIFYTSCFGLAISASLLAGNLIGPQKPDQALIAMSLLLFLTSFWGCFYKRVVLFDNINKQLTTSRNIVFGFATKVYPFDDLSTVHVRKEVPSTQGADLTRQANISFASPQYIVYVDIKGFDRGRKRRVCIKKFSEEKKANALRSKISSLINDG